MRPVTMFGRTVNCTKMAELMEMPFGVQTHANPRNHVQMGGIVFEGICAGPLASVGTYCLVHTMQCNELSPLSNGLIV